MAKKQFEVRGMDATGNIWVVTGNKREVLEFIAKVWRIQGYSGVRVVEIKS